MKTALTIWIACGVSATCLAANPERPPKLTFDKHVDYLKWYDDFVCKGRSDNALEIYQKLCPDETDKGGLQLPKDDVAKQFEKALKAPWDAKDFPQLKAYLDQNGQFLAHYRLAVQRPNFWQTREPGSQTLIDVIFPTFAFSRNACKLLTVESWMRGNHQADRMLANWRTILGNARHFAQEPGLIAGLCGVAERSVVYRQACSAISEQVIEGKNINRAISVLRESDPGASNLTGAIVVEWAFALDTLQSVCKGNKVNRAQWNKLYHKVDSWPPSKKDEKAPPFDPLQTLDEIESYFPKHVDAAGSSISLKSLQAIRKLRKAYEPVAEQNPFLKLMLTDFSRAYELMLRTEVQRRGTLLVLAVHDFKYRHAKWPEKLGELEIDNLKKLRIDPYSDKDFVYRLAKDGPLLYSISSDGKDDNGRHDEKWGQGKDGGDFVFWPVQH
jgi:hypothetical protein